MQTARAANLAGFDLVLLGDSGRVIIQTMIRSNDWIC
jgi:hypothetical protein